MINQMLDQNNYGSLSFKGLAGCCVLSVLGAHELSPAVEDVHGSVTQGSYHLVQTNMSYFNVIM